MCELSEMFELFKVCELSKMGDLFKMCEEYKMYEPSEMGAISEMC